MQVHLAQTALWSYPFPFFRCLFEYFKALLETLFKALVCEKTPAAYYSLYFNKINWSFYLPFFESLKVFNAPNQSPLPRSTMHYNYVTKKRGNEKGKPEPLFFLNLSEDLIQRKFVTHQTFLFYFFFEA